MKAESMVVYLTDLDKVYAVSSGSTKHSASYRQQVSRNMTVTALQVYVRSEGRADRDKRSDHHHLHHDCLQR